jgi:RNA polymerase sigma factor (TIGR02999 family)
MQLTELLRRVHTGDRDALDAVIPLVYAELKRLAGYHLHRERSGQSLQTTALVHEAFLRLADGAHPSYEDRSHFYGIASRLMRQILVDEARMRSAEKRGKEVVVDVAELPDLGYQPDEALLTMDLALEHLAQVCPAKAQLIEMRYFAGMTVEECATALAQPLHTIRKDLRLAQAWLRREMA